MRLHRLRELQHIHADHAFRTPPWGMLLFPLILLAVSVAIGWALINGHLPAALWGSFVLLAPM